MSVAPTNGPCLGEATVNLAKLGLHASERRPNLLASTTTLMLSLMGAGAASHGIEGAFVWDREQQVVQQDLRE